MVVEELLPLLWQSIVGHKLRSALTILGIVIGISSVVLLSSIGEGTRQGIAAQFGQFGTTLVSVMPGREETMGAGAMMGTTRKLTLEDALVLRRVHGVRRMTCNVYGTSKVEYGNKGRDVYTYGVLSDAQHVWRWRPRAGTFIPEGDPEQIPPVCVLGQKLARELFGRRNPLGETVRIGERSYKVIGLMEPKGSFLGFDLDDAAYIPLIHAMRLFNQFEVHEINLDVASHREIERVEEDVRRVLTGRHGEEDFTIVSQQAMMEVIDKVLGVVTDGVIAIAAIAILVGAIGILTITWVSVHERTGEIGLMKAIGASNGQVMVLFLGEATFLSFLGGMCGVGLGVLGGYLLSLGVPALRVSLAPGIIPICMIVSIAVGLLSGWIPARRAAALDPVEALRDE